MIRILKSLTYISILLPCVSVHAALVNGSFENGLTGYSGSTNGQGGVIQSIASGAVLPTDGSQMLYLTTGPGDVGNDGVVDNVTPGIRLDFTVDVGAEIMLFDFNILTEQNTPSSFLNDRARAKLNGICAACGDTASDSIWFRNDSVSVGSQMTIGNAFQLINETGGITHSDGTHYTKQTGWHTAYIDFTEVAGLGLTHDLIFTITEDQNSELFDSALLIDNIRMVSAVPVPPTVWLFGSGIISLISIARRKKM